jgi:hypothetical protein
MSTQERKITHAEDIIEVLLLLDDAIELIDDTIGYVPEYFMKKHKYSDEYNQIMQRYKELKE